jgi:hypothetical protein
MEGIWKRVLWKINEEWGDEVIGGWRKLHNGGLKTSTLHQI